MKLKALGQQLYQKETPTQVKRSNQRCSMKKDVLKIFTKFTGNTCATDSFLIKLQALGLQLY